MPAIEQQTVTLRGELATFSERGADGWGTGTLRLPGKTAAREVASSELFETLASPPTAGPVAIVGKVFGVRAGDAIEVTGVWTDHPRYGWQLKLRSCTPLRPEGTDGAVKWMASRFPDVGETRARELVQRFGDALWTVIEHDHVSLTEIDGITAARAEAIHVAYRVVAGEREHMVQLRGWGLTDNQIGRCKQQWGELEDVVTELRRNPYLLGQEVFGFGFLRADTIANKMGVPRDAPARVRAGIEHLLDEAAGQGHVFVSGAALQRMSAELLGVHPSLVAPAIKGAAQSGRLVRRGWRVYTAKMDAAEQSCAEGIARLMGRDGKAAA